MTAQSAFDALPLVLLVALAAIIIIDHYRTKWTAEFSRAEQDEEG